MSIALQGYRIFIATPGGLEPERVVFRETLREINEDEAHSRGAVYLPAGWESTTAGVGRPQSRINAELRTCDFCVLILWDRWGSPTYAEGETGYESGTEEEYNVARDCLQGQAPMRDILVLFKGVEARQLSDPGPQLSKVMEFKQRLEHEKRLMYATFDTEDELRRTLQRHFVRWLSVSDSAGGAPVLPDAKPAAAANSADPEATLVQKEVRAAGDHDQADTPGAPPVETVDDEPSSGSGARAADERGSKHRGDQAEKERELAQAVVAAPDQHNLDAYARFLRHQGRLAQADEISSQLLALGEAEGLPEASARGYAGLAVTSRKRGDLQASEEHLRRGIEAAEGLRPADGSLLAYLWSNLGLTLRRRKNYGDAAEAFTQAVRFAAELNDSRELGRAHNNLSFIRCEQGDHEAALEHSVQALAFGQEADDPGVQAMALHNRGLSLWESSEADLPAARDAFAKALRIHERRGSISEVALSQTHLGWVELDAGNVREAWRLARSALELSYRANNNQDGVAMSLHLVGRLYYERKAFDQAEHYLSDARDLYERLGHIPGLAGTSADLARALSHQHRHAEALKSSGEATRLATGIDNVALKTRVAAVAEAVEKRAASAAKLAPKPRRRRK